MYTDVTLDQWTPLEYGLHPELISGLSSEPKHISPEFFYDGTGCRLFDQICRLKEYYLSRTEVDILRKSARELQVLFGPHCRLVELGSGNSFKTRILLDHLESPAGYIPVDIAGEYLQPAVMRLQAAYLDLCIKPLPVDFTREFYLPFIPAVRTIIIFLGSTIGNLEPSGAIELLSRMAQLSGHQGGLLIGVDLKKDKLTLERAYNDFQGVTAAFNLNLLTRLNRMFHTNLSRANFRHLACYNEEFGRIEMSLMSLIPQSVSLDGQSISLRSGERITTEYSYKYSPAEFADLASKSGWQMIKSWTDPRRLFSLHYLEHA